MNNHAFAYLEQTLSPHVPLSKSRLETLCLLVLGMIRARTVNLTHIASERPTRAKVASRAGRGSWRGPVAGLGIAELPRDDPERMLAPGPHHRDDRLIRTSRGIRKIIYATNAIESQNRVIRTSIKTRGSFLTDDTTTKLVYLAIRKFERDGRNVREWFAAHNQFARMSSERFDV